mmetsp:Transcript_611/g.1785  ORF Transcript_611/g.1785 Transcript_611/m.1785 type:complete len:249 (-) Transcript_611:39-785(-)
MGCCSSKELVYTELQRNSKKKNERFLASTGSLSGAFIRLKVTPSEQKKWFDQFEKIDRNLSGNVTIDEFFDYVDIEYNRFTSRVFEMFDKDHDNADRSTRIARVTLQFEEFFTGLMSYCTMNNDQLIEFAFRLMDRDETNTLSMRELRELLALVYGGGGLDAKAEQILAKMDKDHDDNVTLQEFAAVCKSNQSLMFPAFNIQRELQGKIMSKSYWAKATDIRAKLRVSPAGWERIMRMHEKRPPVAPE